MPKKLRLPRAPLPRQTGGFHRPGKGKGVHDRRETKAKLRKWSKEDG
jgi:hypothetical protein